MPSPRRAEAVPEWPGKSGGSAEPPKLGSVIVPPPETETPGAAAGPLAPLPAPPGPGNGEIPLFAFNSEPAAPAKAPTARRQLRAVRSEEDTSEVQSHSDLVCRPRLEKK